MTCDATTTLTAELPGIPDLPDDIQIACVRRADHAKGEKKDAGHIGSFAGQIVRW